VAVPLPPPIIRADSLRVVRTVDAQGQVVSYFVDKTTGQRVETLASTYHLVRDPGRFEPPPG
jgi:hypothetical protein